MKLLDHRNLALYDNTVCPKNWCGNKLHGLAKLNNHMFPNFILPTFNICIVDFTELLIMPPILNQPYLIV